MQIYTLSQRKSSLPRHAALTGSGQKQRVSQRFHAVVLAAPWRAAEIGLALLWQILSGLGFPNQFFCDSWVVGFWRADHGRQDIGLER